MNENCADLRAPEINDRIKDKFWPAGGSELQSSNVHNFSTGGVSVRIHPLHTNGESAKLIYRHSFDFAYLQIRIQKSASHSSNEIRLEFL